MLKPPRLIVFGGANGSGKSTLTNFYKRKLEASSVLLDPDAIAKELNPLQPQKAAIQAARYVLQQQQQFLFSGQSFALETTLSSHGNLELIQAAKARGWVVRLLYVGLANPILNVQRVASRVQSGGHDVPEADIRRRYQRSMTNLVLAAELVDLLSVHDNSERAIRRVALIKQHRVIRLVRQNGLGWWESALKSYLDNHLFE
jgi:predicted ABC-type ATPase